MDSSLLLDRGAMVDCEVAATSVRAEGQVYARRVVGVAIPKVAILANGEEDSKGTDLTHAAATALRRA